MIKRIFLIDDHMSSEKAMINGHTWMNLWGGLIQTTQLMGCRCLEHKRCDCKNILRPELSVSVI